MPTRLTPHAGCSGEQTHVPSRAILRGSPSVSCHGARWIAPEKLFTFLLNSCGALMMFTYLFVVLAHFRFPYSDPALRTRVGAQWIAGGAAVAMLAVLVAMTVMPSKQPEMWASLACLGVILVALAVKRSAAAVPA